LPDGLFSNQKSQFGKIFDGLSSKNVAILKAIGIFYGHLGYFMTFFTFCVHLVDFSGFGITYQEKSGNPGKNFFLSFLRSNLRSLQFRTKEMIRLF
jgi:hypothetical protein